MQFYSEGRAMAFHFLALVKHFLLCQLFEKPTPSSAGLGGNVNWTEE
jgi:hypothetical protein